MKRRSELYLVYIGLLMVLFLGTFVDAGARRNNSLAYLQRLQGDVAELELTDLALFTEARYTRHLSQADRHTPFQDHPMAMEHFPSGSLVPPVTIKVPMRSR